MNERIYRNYQPKEDNLSVVSAADINELQRTLEHLQANTFIQADDSFLARSVTSLAHHPEANAMVVNLLDGALQDIIVTYKDSLYDPVTRSIGMAEGALGGYVTTQILNTTGKPMRLPALLSDHRIPEGTSITYEVSYDDQSYFPISPNEAMPLSLESERSTLFFRINLRRNEGEESPRVDAWSILYQDESYAFKFLDDGVDIGIDSLWDGTIIE